MINVIRPIAKLCLIGSVVLLGSCTAARTLLKQAPSELPRGWTEPVRSLLPEPLARQRLEERLYGQLNLTPNVVIVDQQVLDAAALSGKAVLMQWQLRIDFGASSREVGLVALLPSMRPEAPVILTQNFCPNHNVVPIDGVATPSSSGFDCSGGGLMGALMTRVFGRYIVTPPLEEIMDRGYGFAALYPSQFVPDSAQAGVMTLDDLFPETLNRPGALSVWASLFDVAAEAIEADGVDRTMIAYGHSRFGKTALLAGSLSDRIDIVIAHQSGTLGASTLDDGTGESMRAMIDAYPHWAGPNASNYADNPGTLGVTPADLLARLSDKPVLLGNARRDVWSDPWGAFKEAKAAWGAAFSAQSPSDFRPSDDKAYWLRPGTHGVVKEDWPAFLEFLDHHADRPD